MDVSSSVRWSVAGSLARFTAAGLAVRRPFLCPPNRLRCPCPINHVAWEATTMTRHPRPCRSDARSAMVAALVLIALGMTAPAHAGFLTFEAAGANAAAITPTRDAFRATVGGGTVAGANGS